MPTFYKTHWSGHGIKGMFPAACGACRGYVIANVSSDFSKVDCRRCRRPFVKSGVCPTCKGTGALLAEYYEMDGPCPGCDGSGSIKR